MAPAATSARSYSGSVSPVIEKRKPSRAVEKVSITVGARNQSECKTNYLFDRNLHKPYPIITHADGIWLHAKDKRTICDASSGAAVAALGYGNERVNGAIKRQMDTGINYIASSFWGCDIVEDACQELIRGTGGKMSRVYLTGSGSEAMEAALKMSRQFFLEKDKDTPRVNYIAREQSYHGNTLGALGVSGHVARRAPYLPFLTSNVHHIPACNPYRQRASGEGDAAFVVRKAAELEAKFQQLGPETVAAFIAEPVVGAALGGMPAVPGYLRAMRDVCDRHGALLILDEVMCGMGRCGTLHAWQAEGIVPDIQTIGKGIAAGYQNCAAVLVAPKVVQRFVEGTGQFVHGQTYQGMPVHAAAILEVQRIIREDNLVTNVAKQGAYLEKELRRLLGDHPNVGDIRGRGLFWGLEFVRNKETKGPFDPKLSVAQRVHDLAISDPFNLCVYPGTGTVDGYTGDHILLAPAYIVKQEDIDHIVTVLAEVITIVFQEIAKM